MIGVDTCSFAYLDEPPKDNLQYLQVKNFSCSLSDSWKAMDHKHWDIFVGETFYCNLKLLTKLQFEKLNKHFLPLCRRTPNTIIELVRQMKTSAKLFFPRAAQRKHSVEVSGKLSACAVSWPMPVYRFAFGSKEAWNIKASLKHHLMLHSGTGEEKQYNTEMLWTTVPRMHHHS